MNKKKMDKKKIAVLTAALAIGVIVVLRVLALRADHRYIGTIEATKVDIAPRVNSVIADFPVREGNPVKKGEVLVRLAGEDLKIAADAANQDFVRAEKLYRSGSIPQEAYEHLKTKRDDARLRWEWTTITSPLNGTVLNRYREPGEWVSPGMKLLTLADLSTVWAYIYVDQPVMARLKLGQAVEGTIPEQPGKKWAGTITRIADEAEFTPKNVQTWSERTRLVYAIKVSFPNGESTLKPGMSIQVEMK